MQPAEARQRTARQPSPLPGAAAPLKELGPLGSRHTARSRCSAVPPREAKTAPKGFPLSAVLPQRDRYRDHPAAGRSSAPSTSFAAQVVAVQVSRLYRAGARTRKVAGDRSSVPRRRRSSVRAVPEKREVDSLLEYVTTDPKARGAGALSQTQRRASAGKG